MSSRIVISGNLGVGKTSLAELLARELFSTVFYEPVLDNPYLVDFYMNMQRWAFHLQIYYLQHRTYDYQKSSNNRVCIFDRFIFEDGEIFIPLLRDLGFLSAREYNTCHTLYITLLDLLPPPDVVIYLHAPVPVLFDRIRHRKISAESPTTMEYVYAVQSRYDQWVNLYFSSPIIKIDTSEVDIYQQGFVSSLADKINNVLIEKDKCKRIL